MGGRCHTVLNVRRDCLVKRLLGCPPSLPLLGRPLGGFSSRKGFGKRTCRKSVKIHCDGSVASGMVSSLRGGEVAEWFKAHAWKACVANPYRGFESLPLRQFFLPQSQGVAPGRLHPALSGPLQTRPPKPNSPTPDPTHARPSRRPSLTPTGLSAPRSRRLA